jgi:hypothetical protein
MCVKQFPDLRKLRHHTSHVTRHTSHVTRHTSCVTRPHYTSHGNCRPRLSKWQFESEAPEIPAASAAAHSDVAGVLRHVTMFVQVVEHLAMHTLLVEVCSMHARHKPSAARELQSLLSMLASHARTRCATC